MQEAKKSIPSNRTDVNYSDKSTERFFEKIDTNGPLPDQSIPAYQGIGQCHIWTAAKYSNGYGHAVMDGQGSLAHRVIWQMNFGPIPDGLVVMHRCDRPECCRISHLRLGTIKDNSQDMMEKGRHTTLYGEDNPRFGFRVSHCSKGHPMTGDNVIFTDKGRARRCLICYRISSSDRTRRFVAKNRDLVNARKRESRAPYLKGPAVGEGHGLTKLRENDVREIRDASSHGETLVSIAKRYPVSAATIRNIVMRSTWKHVA